MIPRETFLNKKLQGKYNKRDLEKLKENYIPIFIYYF